MSALGGMEAVAEGCMRMRMSSSSATAGVSAKNAVLASTLLHFPHNHLHLKKKKSRRWHAFSRTHRHRVTCARRDRYPNTESRSKACMVHPSRPRLSFFDALLFRWRLRLPGWTEAPSDGVVLSRFHLEMRVYVSHSSTKEDRGTNAGAQVKGRYILFS